MSYEEVAEQFSVGRASVSRWLRLKRESGDVAPRPRGGGRKRLIGEAEEKALDKLVLAHPDWTEKEFAKALSEALGSQYGESTVGRAIRRLGYGVKKRPLSLPSKIVPMSSENESSSESEGQGLPLRVLFLWTKPVSTPR